jgi:Bacterial PH domain
MIAQPKAIRLFAKETYCDTIWRSCKLFYSGQILRGIVGGGIICFFIAGALNGPNFRWVGIIAFVMFLALVLLLFERQSTYYYNRCVLTNRRVINIRRRHMLARKERREVQLDAIREVNVHANLIESLFDIGTLQIVGTQSRHDFCLGCVDDPIGKQYEILEMWDLFVRK